MPMTAEEMIDNIPRFESSDGQIISLSDRFLKHKLHNALANPSIINLARGEGRSTALNDIVFHPEILFDWGEKSMHAFLDSQSNTLREFCDPDVVNKEVMIEYIYKYAWHLERMMIKHHALRVDGDVHKKIEQLINIVVNETIGEKLLCLKEWLIYAFHTMGAREFAKITPCISCSYGSERFEVARRFGGYNGRNKYYVIIDNWVNQNEEGVTYKKTDYVNSILEDCGLKWFSNHHKERELKILLFVKKSDGEGTDFYYMGQMEPVEWNQTVISNDTGKQLPIMNFQMILKQSVREDIYDYITG
ncbi:MAG: DUF3427 domain-containing protein [Lachnospiraceae bacterium]|nr:DUF3427 domain-containing protein [Lachnospiraceae bacterium]